MTFTARVASCAPGKHGFDGVTGAALSGAEVNETGAAIGAKFSAYLKSILKEL